MQIFPWRKAAQVAVGVVTGADKADAAEQIAAILAERDARHAEELREERARYHDLVQTLIDLVREQKAAPHISHEPSKSPLSALGPKTHAALASEARGQSPDVRRGMQAKALALHAQGMKDEDIAAAVQRGEPVSL